MIRTFGKVAPHAEPHFRDEGIVTRGGRDVLNSFVRKNVIRKRVYICYFCFLMI